VSPKSSSDKVQVVFLDRDGVINQDPKEKYYVHDWSEFQFIPDSINAAKLLQDHHYRLFVISNQAGVGRGMVKQSELDNITTHMLKVFREAEVNIEGVFYCTHQRDEGCGCRKPQTELYTKAISGLDVDFKQSFVIGDSERDIEAGKRLGCKTILVLSGLTDIKDVPKFKIQPTHVANNLKGATQWILESKKS